MQQLEHQLPYIELTGDLDEPVRHVLNDDMIHAVNAALAIRRPLLIWGEPGIGKSQLARAVACHLKRPFLPFVADAQTRSHDLMWRFDAVARLACAQIQRPENQPEDGSDPLAVENFMVPGVLWWAFSWDTAIEAAENRGHEIPDKVEAEEDNGAVVLIDEIDKADPDVPNGLLEALGANRFKPLGRDKAVVRTGPQPLVMITTNEERMLPDAFRRRCLSLYLEFPKKGEEQRQFLVERAVDQPAFPGLSEEHLARAAELLVEDRAEAERKRLHPLPGQAEYFDLLRGLQQQIRESGDSAEILIQRLRKYAYRKHPVMASTPPKTDQ